MIDEPDEEDETIIPETNQDVEDAEEEELESEEKEAEIVVT